MAKYQVTSTQFQAFVDAGTEGYNSPRYWTKAGLHLTIIGKVADAAEKARLWALFKVYPVGYDPGTIWQSADDPEYGLLRLDPARIEYFDVTQPGRGGQKHVWRPSK